MPSRNSFAEFRTTIYSNLGCVKFRFAELMTESLSAVCQLLKSKQTSDVLEAIEFLVSANEFEMAGSHLAIKQMLPLISSREQAISEAVFNAYKRLYFDVPG